MPSVQNYHCNPRGRLKKVQSLFVEYKTTPLSCKSSVMRKKNLHYDALCIPQPTVSWLEWVWYWGSLSLVVPLTWIQSFVEQNQYCCHSTVIEVGMILIGILLEMKLVAQISMINIIDSNNLEMQAFLLSLLAQVRLEICGCWKSL